MKNGNFMYDSHGRIVYDYGDTPGMQRPVSGNSNALGSQSWMIVKWKRLFQRKHVCRNFLFERF